MTVREIEPLAEPPDSDVQLPGSKSITNRALVAAAMADGISELENCLVADDTEAMAECLRALGARIEIDAETAVVTGTGGQLSPGPVALNVRQSGTTARFVAAVAAAGEGEYELDGADQMRARPMAPLVAALRQLGVQVQGDGESDDRLPLRIRGGVAHSAADIRGDVSSQFLSGLMLAAPLYPRGLRLGLSTPLVSRPYVEMTRSVMAAFGADASVENDHVEVRPGEYRAADYKIEPDASAASYFFAAAAITGGRVRVPGLRTGGLQGDAAFVDVLEQMGATVNRADRYTEVIGGRRLSGVDVDLRDMSDTAPTLAVVAAFADSPTRVTGIGFIRRKETDRIAAIVNELRRCGVEADEEADGFAVRPGSVHGATVETYDDHRMAMSFAVLGLVVPAVTVSDPECVAKTFPRFFSTLDTLRR